MISKRVSSSALRHLTERAVGGPRAPIVADDPESPLLVRRWDGQLKVEVPVHHADDIVQVTRHLERLDEERRTPCASIARDPATAALLDGDTGEVKTGFSEPI